MEVVLFQNQRADKVFKKKRKKIFTLREGDLDYKPATKTEDSEMGKRAENLR